MIVVTTPTGLIGHQVVHLLLAAGAPVRVIVRDRSRLPGNVRAEVEVVEGSHGDTAVVDEALDGADAVFWLVPPNPQADSVHDVYVGFSRPAAATVTRHGVTHVVGVSALGRGTPLAERAGLVTGSLAMDDLMAGTGAAYRALVMPSFMDNVARQAATIRDAGTLTSPISGTRPLPWCATRDIAAAAAALLLDRTWEGVNEVPVLGPEDLSFAQLAETVSEVTGLPVRFQQVTPQAFLRRTSGAGMSEAMAQGMLDMYLAKEAGLDSAVPRTAATRSPTTFRSWCETVLLPAVTTGAA